MTNPDMPDLTPMLTQILRAGLAAIATPEAAEQLATFSRNYYDALRARGFGDEGAMALVAAHGAALLRSGK
jgi:hypothetical protein